MKKNEGFSLIELVISLAILAIVGLVLAGFLTISSKIFRKENVNVNLQYESQLTINQLKDLVVDSNRGIAYGLQTVSGNFVLVNMADSNSETNILNQLEAEDSLNVNTVKRCIIIYNEVYDSVSAAYKYPVIKIVWDPVTKRLTYAEHTFDTLTQLESDRYLNALGSSDYDLMSENIEKFSVKMVNEVTKEISVDIELASGSATYSSLSSISLRNKVIVSDDIHTIYADNDVIKPSLINGVSIKKAGTVITADSANVGDTIQYTAAVDAQFGASAGSDSVQWILTGNSTYGTGAATSVSQSGELKISPYELSGQITLTAVSVVDASKKAVIIVSVNNGLGEFGYVNSLALGEVMVGDIAAPTAPGGPYEYYGVAFEDNSSYITYVNEAKLSTESRGVSWTVTTDAPAGSYTWGTKASGTSLYGLPGTCPVYVKVNYAAMGHTFRVTGTTNANNYAGTKISTYKEFIVSGLQQPLVEITPTINLEVNSQTLARNGKVVITEDIQNVENKIVTLEIIPGSGFNESVTNKAKSNVYIMSTSDSNKFNLFAKTLMDWKTSFTFDVKMHVTGKTNLGNTVDKTIIRTITVPAVGVTVSSEGQYIKFSRFQTSIPTVFNYTNLNVGSAGVVDMNYYPVYGTNSVIFYPDYSNVYWSRALANEDLTYVNGNIILNRNLMKTLYDNYIWFSQNKLVCVLSITGTGNEITKTVNYYFY